MRSLNSIRLLPMRYISFKDNMDRSEYVDLGFAKLDLDRRERTGCSEVVFCQGKSPEQVVSIFGKLYETEGEVLGTRADLSHFKNVKEAFPNVSYDETSRLLILEKEDKKAIGNIAVCCAGTADLPVAKEAAGTARFFGNNVTEFYDIGVSGLHRITDNIDGIRKANAIICVAGMEGALASVIGGLVKVPIIAVPTSVGYGASFEGLSALLTMINSCANGISVVNIDNGYGAGYIASQINHLAERGNSNG